MRAAVLIAKQQIETVDHDIGTIGPNDVRIQIRAGGICGSDLHYYNHYRMGDFPVREPFILGHEGAGIVECIGSNVTEISVGDVVTVNPSQPCRSCEFCLSGRELLCSNMKFLGSSRRTPHVQGIFSEFFITDKSQCFVVPSDLSVHIAAFAEPLSVALHAIRKAGCLIGANILITGAGPIGALVLVAAKLAGACSITIIDILDAPLKVAEKMGADHAFNIIKNDQILHNPKKPRGSFDVAFEASGNPSAVLNAIRYVRPGGILVQIGTFPDPNILIPTDQIMVKELSLKSSFRFDREFAWSVRYLSERRVNVEPLLSHTFPMEKANEAFNLAADRSRAMKVHLAF